MWTLLFVLLFFWVYRRQRRFEKVCAEQEALRLATVRLREQEQQMWQEHKDALDRIESLLEDVLVNQDTDILNLSLGASEDEQVAFLRQHYEEDESGRT